MSSVFLKAVVRMRNVCVVSLCVLRYGCTVPVEHISIGFPTLFVACYFCRAPTVLKFGNYSLRVIVSVCHLKLLNGVLTYFTIDTIP